MRLGENVKDVKAVKSFKALPEKLKAKHQDRFDYSKAIFIDMGTPIEIICKEHGSFLQTPQQHLTTSQCCPKCVFKYRKEDPNKVGFDSFLERMNIAQNNNYIFLDSNFTILREKYNFKCIKHNTEFVQGANDAIVGKTGCALCKSEKITLANSKTHEQWLEQAITKHGSKFEYDKAVYQGDKVKVTIKCPHHGYFEQTAGQHLVYGCDKCARDAVNVERYKDTPTIFYTFEYKGVYKIGITTKKSAQIRYYKDIDDWENTSNLIEVPFVNFPEAYMFEQFLINNYQEYRYWGEKLFNKTGITEVFTKNIYEMYLRETLQ